MTERYLVYPLVLVALGQLIGLWRTDARWYAAQIGQRLVILSVAVCALIFPGGEPLTSAAWLLFAVFAGGPRWLLALSTRQRQAGNWARAAHWEDLAGRLIMGQLGQLHRQHAQALRHLAWDETDEAEALLVRLAADSLPSAARGLVNLWRLMLLAEQRAWARVVTGFEEVDDWGTLWFATRARLLAARAYAETGAMLRALRCAQMVVLSPAVVRLGQGYWQLRVRLAAMAGDAGELEYLLGQRPLWRSGFQQLAAYWRGRCALALGDRGGAIKLLTRAYALTHPRDRGWREALRHHLARAEASAPAVLPPAHWPGYTEALAAVRHAEEQAAPWRALMQFSLPAPATLIVLGEIALVFIAWTTLPADWEDRVIAVAGNGAVTIRLNEWWRLVTTLFLHATWLHLGLNGLALWMFGSAVERAYGWVRWLVIFFLGGALGNLLSAALARYELAIGASAGVFALLGAYTVAVSRLRTPPYAGLRPRLLGMLLMLIAADFLIGWREPQVDNLAHIGGFVAGIILGLLVNCIHGRSRLQIAPTK